MKFDTIIIGAGPAGMTAALYAARANLKVAIVEQGLPGGQMNNTSEIENYPGYASISGADLSEKMFEPLEGLNVEYIFGTVTKVSANQVEVDGETYETKTVIIASGCTHKTLDIPGEDEFNSRGVSYCAICDGAFFKNKKILVVGGGDSALEEALLLTEYSDDVTIVHRRDEFRAQAIIQERAKHIPVIYDTVVKEIHGDDIVKSVTLENVKTNETSEMEVDAVFIYVGLTPNTSFVDWMTEDGWIKTNDKMETAYPGIYAIGDVRDKHLRQITTAVGDGAIAGQEVYNFVQGLK